MGGFHLTFVISLAPPHRLGEAAERQLLVAGAALLTRYRGREVFTELRDQCNANPERLMTALPYASAACMLRAVLHTSQM